MNELHLYKHANSVQAKEIYRLEKLNRTIIEFIKEEIEREKENYKDCERCGGINSVAWGMASGAIDSYKKILDFIKGEE